MKKSILPAFIILTLSSCSHNYGDYGESYINVEELKNKTAEEITKEDIQANVSKIFGYIDPNQDWSLTTPSSLTITADADLYDIAKLQILSESPFLNSSAKVLSEAEVTKGETITLNFDAPTANKRLIAACVDSKGHYYIKGFEIGDTELSFQNKANVRSMTRGTSSSYPAPNKIVLENNNAIQSYNALRTWIANLAAASKDNDFKKWAKDKYISLWEEKGWEEERFWKPNDNGLENNWTIKNNTVLREISNINDEERATLEAIFNENLYRIGDGTGWAERKDNLPTIRESEIVKFYNNHLTSDGNTPITIIPIKITSSESHSCHLYYYYYNPDDIPSGMSEAEYIKHLPKFKAIQLWHTMSAAGIPKNGSDDFFKKHEYLLPFYGEPSLFSNQYTSSERDFTTDGKLYRIRNSSDIEGNQIYMTFLPMNIENKLVAGYAVDDVNLKNQLWQIFTDKEGHSALYNIAAKKFLVWEGSYATVFSSEFNVVKKCLYNIVKAENQDYYNIWRYNNKNLGLGADFPKNYGIWTDKTPSKCGAKFNWYLEEYSGNKETALNNVIFDDHITSATSPSITIPKGYRIGFVLRKLLSNQDWKNDNIVTGVKNGCCYSSGGLNKEINNFPGHFGTAKSKYTMQDDDPRVAYFTANGKTYLTFEDGCDAQFSDLIIEVGGYDQSIVTAAPVGTEEKNCGVETSCISYVKEIAGIPYLMCFEDSPIADYDMNDVVLKIERLNPIQIKVSLVACGAYDELYLKGLNGKILNENTEIHALFGADVHSFVNTQKGSQKYSPIEEVFTVSANTRLSEFIMGISVYDKTKNYQISLAGKGEDPHAIVVPAEFDYPIEKASLNSAYPLFSNWARQAENDRLWFLNGIEDYLYSE